MRNAICLFFADMSLAGCTTTEQPDGSTRVSVSLSDKLGLQPKVPGQVMQHVLGRVARGLGQAEPPRPA